MIKQVKIATIWRCAVSVMLLSIVSSLALGFPLVQDEEEDTARRIWNKQFMDSRASVGKAIAKSPKSNPTRPGATQPKTDSDVTAPGASSAKASADVASGELIGVTLWRLRPATTNDDQRILLQQAFLPERVEADTTFTKRDRVRLAIEVPREGNSYLYIIDREVYPDGTMSDPYLIFPLQSTRGGDNVVTAGKPIEIPARDDALPWFDLSQPPMRKDRVGERLMLIISPKPLDFPLSNQPLKLDPAQVAAWEKQWSGPTEKREAKIGATKTWTTNEKDAGEGKRLLMQGDPLPQTIYRILGKQGGTVLVNLQLQVTQ